MSLKTVKKKPIHFYFRKSCKVIGVVPPGSQTPKSPKSPGLAKSPLASPTLNGDSMSSPGTSQGYEHFIKFYFLP